MDFDAVVAWIDAYVDAWRSHDAARIGALFTDDATYSYHPWEDPLRGRDAIVDDWLKEPDEPGSWDAHYYPLLVDGDRAIITGVTRYVDGEVYSNLFVVDFDGSGRCSAFTEWYMLHPDPSPQGGAVRGVFDAPRWGD